jgi:hypothetical protein
MPTTLAEYTTSVSQFLFDTGLDVWPAAAIEDAIRHALADYSLAWPCTRQAVMIALADGRQVALNEIDALLAVMDVYWPFDSSADQQPANQALGWYLYWDDGQPVIQIGFDGCAAPKAGDEILLTYTTPHTIVGLDSAAVTTVHPSHILHIVRGAAAYAALSRTADLAETQGRAAVSAETLRRMADYSMIQFKTWLTSLQRSLPATNWAGAWQFDKWESR